MSVCLENATMSRIWSKITSHFVWYEVWAAIDDQVLSKKILAYCRLLAALFLFSGSLFIAAFTAWADDDDPPSTKSNVDHKHIGVFLAKEVQLQSGLKTTILTTTEFHPEFIAYGKAIPIQSLNELRHQYLVAAAEHHGAAARLDQSTQSLLRQQELFREGATSKHALQLQQAQWQTDKTQIQANSAQQQRVFNEALLNWGKTLTEWLLHTEHWDRFLTGEQILLQIYLPTNKQLDHVQIIAVSGSGDRQTAGKASLISVAPQTDGSTQGESYFFQTDDTRIRTGMRIVAWIPEKTASQSGIVIPKSALLWHLDQAFVYIKIAEEQFSRRNVTPLTTTIDGYFIGNELTAGDQLVITGGQMLLSEEFRGQIPSEDD